MKSKGINGKRTWPLVPALAMAGMRCNRGYEPYTDLQALLAVQWICRRLARWQTKTNVQDLTHLYGAINVHEWPSLTGQHAQKLLETYMARLANPTRHPTWMRFARKMLGFRRLDRPIIVKQRLPPGGLPQWMDNLVGAQLKKSPNQYHDKAVWLQGGRFRLSKDANRLTFAIGYSYRHESGWGISLQQNAGEPFEKFTDRIWRWLEPQIQWRHPEAWYHRFFGSHDGMKQNELRTCADPERKMHQFKEEIRNVFAWGKGCPGMWENELGSLLVRDTHEQYRTFEKIEMTGTRLHTVKRWIKQDRKIAETKKP